MRLLRSMTTRRALGLGLVVDLHEHGQAAVAGLVVEPPEGVVVQRSDARPSAIRLMLGDHSRVEVV